MTDEAIDAQIAAQEGLREVLEKANALAAISGGVAHDLNNVLAAILGNAELLEEDLGTGAPAGELREFARDIAEAADRGARLVGALLQYARPPGGGRDQPVDVAELLARTALLLRGSLGSAIDLSLTAPADLGLARFDTVRFRTALLSLALNARRALNGAGAIVVEARLTDAEPAAASRWVEIDVLDGGEGMSEAVLARCREPFFTTRRSEGAAGLGLTAADEFARDAGGSLQVTSTPGDGTRARLRLPTDAPDTL